MPPKLIDAPCALRNSHRILHAHSRYLTTTAPYLALIPPESPKYIDIPRAVQPHQPFPIHMKGVLPVPRPIFRRKARPEDPDKSSPAYLADVTPEPIIDKTTPSSSSQTSEFVSWKARQAEARRRNLREGLTELADRKQRIDRYTRARSNRKNAERTQALEAPERDDERLTNPSVMQNANPARYRILPDPTREARLEQKRANIAAMEAMKIEERRNKLHTLYVNAGDFITTGKQLDRAIDNAFDDLHQFTNDQKKGLNVWNLGVPETVQELLNRKYKNPNTMKAVEAAEGNTIVTRERMRRIAEELTGGKMVERT